MIISDNPQQTEQESHESILIVDDEAHLLKLTQEQLKMAGYQTYIAETAESALEILSNHNEIKLLLSDIMLPDDVTGYELARRATAMRPDLHVLFASGYSADAVRDQGMNISEEDLLQKPFRHDVLTSTVRQALDRPTSLQSFL